MPTFPVLDISEWRYVSDEPGGTKPKYWVGEPGGDGAWLFRQVIHHPTTGVRQGEDWAEKIAAELANKIGVPAARAELARTENIEGVILKDLRPTSAWEDQPGVVLLEELLGEFDPRESSQYTLEAIRTALTGVKPPPGFEYDDLSAFDVFSGYLVLDALIANRDRHARNWSVLVDPDGERHLMGSYDHASSLNFAASDESRKRVLAGDPDLAQWCGRGTAVAFRNGASTSLVQLAHDALTMCGASAATLWARAVSEITPDWLRDLAESVPTLSEVARTFVVQVLTTNRGRVLDV